MGRTRGRAWSWVLVPLIAVLAVRAGVAADRPELAKARFAAKQRAILFEAGTERVKLGSWCRDAGLVAQATASFIRAVEESDGKNWYAIKVLDLMRTLDDKFWRAVNPHPSKAYLNTFEKKSRKLDSDRQDLLFRLARDGYKAEMVEEPIAVWSDLVRETDRPLAFDAQERIVLPSGEIPADVSAKMKASAITLNGQLYLRDDFLEMVPQVKEIREASGERVRVRFQGTTKAPGDLLATLEALLPFLEEDLGGRPTKRLSVFVFQDRATWKTWLEAAKLPGFAAASGLADGATNTAIVCADGIDGEALRGMCMHEMSHLFQYGVTPVVMPSWYSEGFAETYGGDGTFTWSDGKLTAGGLMSAGELGALKTAEGYIPLAEVVQGDALKLLTADKGKGRRFYSESWALLRYLRSAAPADLQARFRLWETACRGAALGAQVGKPREQDAAPASTEFQRRFGAELPAIEKGFRAWLATL